MIRFPVLTMSILWLLICLLAVPADAARVNSTIGDWPDDWPEALETLRERSVTVHATPFTVPIQDHFEIPLYSRAEFDRYWLELLKVRSEKSPITISRLNSSEGRDDREPAAIIRVYVPAAIFGPAPPMRDDAGNFISSDRVRLWFTYTERPISLTKDELTQLDPDEIVPPLRVDLESLKKWRGDSNYPPAPPWPSSILNEDGSLPECVNGKCNADGPCTWRACGDRHPGTCYRVRTEIRLQIDEGVIGLKDVTIPDDAEVVDKFRFGF